MTRQPRFRCEDEPCRSGPETLDTRVAQITAVREQVAAMLERRAVIGEVPEWFVKISSSSGRSGNRAHGEVQHAEEVALGRYGQHIVGGVPVCRTGVLSTRSRETPTA